MKKLFMRLAFVALAAMTLSVSMTSCSDDKDEPQTEETQPTENEDEKNLKEKLVGTWMHSQNWGYRLDADGTGYGIEYNDYWEIKWTVSGDNLIIRDAETNELEMLLENVSVSDDVLSYESNGSRDIMVLSSKFIPGGNNEDDEPEAGSLESKIIGVWVDYSESWGMEFKRNGIGCFYDITKEYGFHYQIKGDKITIKYDDDTDYETYMIKRITASEMTIYDYEEGETTTLYRNDDWDRVNGSGGKLPYAGSPIVGKWQCRNFEGETGLVVTLQFNADGTCSETMTYDGETDTTSSSFDYSGKKLIWYNEDAVIYNTYGDDMTVWSITSSSMVLSYSDGSNRNTFRKI